MRKGKEPKTPPGADAAAGPRGAAEHKATLDAGEVALLNGLSTGPARAERAKLAQAETLMDEETLEAIRRYRGFFASADVDVSAALDALPEALALRSLKHRLDSAAAIVQRRLADAVEPIATASSEVHRLVAAAPEHSTMRASFALMERRWQETYKGGRPAKGADEEPAKKVDAEGTKAPDPT